MPAWIYALSVVGVLWAVFVAVFHPFRRGAHAAPRELPVTRVDLPAVGSMSLAAEQTLRLPGPPWVPPAEPWLTAPLPGGQSACHGCAQTDYGLACRADLGGRCVRPALVGPYGGQLGPRARDVLDRYEARRLACWGF